MPLLDPLSSVVEALKKDKIIPDVVPGGFVPSVLFSVTWGDSEVMLGNELTKSNTVNIPNVQISPMGAIDGQDMDVAPSYTLAMFDPDAPSYADAKFGPFRHWVKQELKAPTASDVVAAASVERDLLSHSPDPIAASSHMPDVTPYRPPAPGPGTGVHRYVFLLFQEPFGGYTVESDASERGTELEMRRCWPVMDFAKKHNLKLVGANYFKLKAD